MSWSAADSAIADGASDRDRNGTDLDRRAAMRSVLIALLLVGCAPTTEDDLYIPPDSTISCDIGAFEIAAPREALHYVPSMDVVIDESELWASLSLQMVDELSNSYQWTADTTSPYPADAGSWWNRDTFHYELAPNHRYTLTVSHCTNIQTVTFFTSAQ
jgi:hypothetical protein